MDIEITGTLVVEADSQEDAVDLARQATPMMSGKPLIGPRVELSGAAPVVNHTLSPEKISNKHGLMSAGQGGKPRLDA